MAPERFIRVIPFAELFKQNIGKVFDFNNRMSISRYNIYVNIYVLQGCLFEAGIFETLGEDKNEC